MKIMDSGFLKLTTAANVGTHYKFQHLQQYFKCAPFFEKKNTFLMTNIRLWSILHAV